MQVQHRLIIRHPLRRAILVVDDQGEPRLPAFTAAYRHTAEVDYINAAVRERFGLLTTVLQSMHHSDPHGDVVIRVHELETHGDSALRSNTLQWCERAELLSLPDREERVVVAEWLAGAPVPQAVADGREWTRPGWIEEVRGWLEPVLRDAGRGPVREIIQLRAWPSSCVLRVRAASGDCYFKAVPESLRRECAVTEYLAHHIPDAVPPVIATDPERRWLLMAACSGRKLEETTDVTLWERAAARYARPQVACLPRVHELGGAGSTRWQRRSGRSAATPRRCARASPTGWPRPRSSGSRHLCHCCGSAVRSSPPAGVPAPSSTATWGPGTFSPTRTRV